LILSSAAIAHKESIMKNQKGFTLIELLLVLAIIGIISAIALPALLGQRARARDKTATSGSIGRIGDIVGQWDKNADPATGNAASAVPALIETYLKNTLATKDTNPWDPTALVMDSASHAITGAADKTAFESNMTAPTAKGQGLWYIQLPASTSPGFVGIALLLDQKDSAGSPMVVRKAVPIE
jgi:prepilin-type N-terminal cleavage/methylation domain-containing protein